MDLDRLYLLAGEGCYLCIYDHEANELVHSESVFAEQAIHGIVRSVNEPETEQRRDLLLWGGRSICVFCIGASSFSDSSTPIFIQSILEEVRVDDWILNGCFGGNGNTHAYFVTAHNEVYVLTGDNKHRRIAAGPKSILYSAHVLWVEGGRLVVAAGTVYGEILLWSTHIGNVVKPAAGYLHHRFTGHEGSVFGIRISESAEHKRYRRLLASCSDDRTIRVWDISEVADAMNSTKDDIENVYGYGETTSNSFVALTMGHASRIWGVRFIGLGPNGWRILSHGEDGTAQTWLLAAEDGLKHGTGSRDPPHSTLRHKMTYGYHSGKNLWAVAVLERVNDKPVIATGGADGRVTSFCIQDGFTYQITTAGVRALDQNAKGNADLSIEQPQQHRMNPASSNTRSIIQSDLTSSSAKSIFTALKGPWKLCRRLESANPTYPSGTLDGGAKFDQKAPSDKRYDIEYLYSEWGEFVTEQGLTMKATRQYVYRYQESKHEISVWFVKPEDRTTVEYLFHILSLGILEAKISGNTEGGRGFDVTASGYHLCVEDYYDAKYSFRWEDSDMKEWLAQFTVIGPHKDYVAKATYTREKYLDQPRSLKSTSKEFTNSRPSENIERGFQLPKSDAFKTYVWISEHEFLTTTEQGYILLGTLDMGENGDVKIEANPIPYISWEVICNRTFLKSSSTAASIVSMGIALFGGTDGTIYLYHHAHRRLDYIHKYLRKLAYVRAQRLQKPWDGIQKDGTMEPDGARGLGEDLGNSQEKQAPTPNLVGIVATCLGLSQAYVLLFRPGEGKFQPSLLQFTLTLDDDFIVTSSRFVESAGVLLLGSRKGNMAVYNLKECCWNLSPITSISSIQPHKDAITTIEVLPNDNREEQEGKVWCLTTSRDGTCAIHRMGINRAGSPSKAFDIKFQTVHVVMPPFGPNIEGAWLNPTNNDIILWGFRGTKFVVWNEIQKTEMMSVDCGGAHRNWAYIPYNENRGGGSFVWTKASVCNIHFLGMASHQVFQSGGHGREIKAMAISRLIVGKCSHESRYIATGAEDTTIRVFDNNSRCVSILGDHTTGIQQLGWPKAGERLFSAAGCEEFFVWRVTPIPFFGGIGIVREAVCPRVTDDGDLRIMDFEIEVFENPPIFRNSTRKTYMLYMAYSDSSVRIFWYDPAHSQKFSLLSTGLYSTFCLTQAAELNFNGSSPTLCTASTDGHLALWPLEIALSRKEVLSMSRGGSSKSLQWATRIQVHRNSIKSREILYISTTEAILATGGDDGALAFTRLVSTGTTTPPMHSTLLIPRAHASAVTAIVSLGKNSRNSTNKMRTFDLASVGNDQRLKIWKISVDLHQAEVRGIKVKKWADLYTSVADASSLDVYQDADERRWLYVAGIGIECWKIRVDRESGSENTK